MDISKLLETVLFIFFGSLDNSPVIWIQAHQDSWFVEEHAVDLLEGTTTRLNSKEISQRDEYEANDAPDPATKLVFDMCRRYMTSRQFFSDRLPEKVAANIAQTNGCYHHDNKLHYHQLMLWHSHSRERHTFESQ